MGVNAAFTGTSPGAEADASVRVDGQAAPPGSSPEAGKSTALASAAFDSTGTSYDASSPLKDYSPHDWRTPADEMSTAGIVQEVAARRGLADALQEERRHGIPLGLQQLHFVTLDDV